MTAIPSGLHTGIDAKDIARATLALQSVAVPAPATLADASQSIAPFAQNIGVAGWVDGFKLYPDPANAAQAKFEIQLPYSPRIFSAYRSLRKAILALPARAGTLAAFISTGTLAPPTAAHLEQYLYDRAVAHKANGGDVKISTQFDALTKRPYVSIVGTMAYTVDVALADPDPFQGGGD